MIATKMCAWKAVRPSRPGVMEKTKSWGDSKEEEGEDKGKEEKEEA